MNILPPLSFKKLKIYYDINLLKKCRRGICEGKYRKLISIQLSSVSILNPGVANKLVLLNFNFKQSCKKSYFYLVILNITPILTFIFPIHTK